MTGDGQKSRIAGAIIAGGTARRMGGGLKFLCEIGGRPILAHVVERAAAQASPLVLNVNSDDPRLAAFGLPTIADRVPGRGPLEGIRTALLWAAGTPATHLLTVSADTPFFPRDLAAVLLDAAKGGLAVAASGGRRHGVFALWPLALAAEVERLLAQGERRVHGALDALGAEEAAFPVSPFDPFFNINTPEDLAAANALARDGKMGES
jgi:molybdopterin-guanine dinucleotide biosynthesis protein A